MTDPTDADGASAPAATEGPAKARSRGCLFELIETLILTVAVFLGIQTFVAQPYRIEGGSMETTLLPDQYVLIDKLTPRWAPYARGEVVVLDPPAAASSANGTPFIKRVIGLAGDRIELKDGVVFVNGSALDEPYVFTENGVRQTTDAAPGGLAEWLVPPGDVFVLGDHRQNSSDSRIFGPIEAAHVIGRAWLRYWPVNSFGILAKGDVN